MNNILLLEDLHEIRAWLKSLVLQVFPTARITECSRVQDALAHVSSGEKFDLGLIDLGLPDGSGTDVVAALRDAQPDAQSVVVTIHDDDEHLFPALQAGAYGYILKEQSRELITEPANVIACRGAGSALANAYQKNSCRISGRLRKISIYSHATRFTR